VVSTGPADISAAYLMISVRAVSH